MTDTRPLTVHLDINGTCTPIDNTDTDASPDALVNMYLSKSCFGCVTGSHNKDDWSWIAAPWPEILDREWMHHQLLQGKIAMSHYDYLRSTNQDKKVSYTFLSSVTDTDTAAQLRALHAQLLACYAQESAMLFPSAVRVFQTFPQAKILLRTFGVDAPAIISVLRHAHGIERTFVGYRLRMVSERRELDDDEDDETRFSLEPVIEASPPFKSFTGTREQVGNYLEALSSDAYIIDDYQNWCAHARSAKYGKPIFPITESRRGNVLQIAFDDNDCMDTCGHPDATFVRINPAAPMLDEEFFVRHVQRVMELANTNHTQDVELDSKSYSRRSLDRASKTLIDYLRDCKAPALKRSLAHLFEHFCHEPLPEGDNCRNGVGRNHAKFPRMLLCRVIEELIDANQLYCIKGSLGSTQPKASDKAGKQLRCNLSDWIVYNPYPHQKRKQEQAAEKHSHDPEDCHGDKPYPCIDAQIYYQGQKGKWTKGHRRSLTTFDVQLRLQEEEKGKR